MSDMRNVSAQRIPNNIVSPITNNITIPTITALQRINLGDVESFKNILSDRRFIGDVLGIIWNEERIGVITQNNTTVVQFYPEINPGVKIFLTKKEKNRRGDFFGVIEGPVVWNGEFEAVQFTKAALIKFLQTYSDGIPDEILKTIKSTRIQERRTEDDELLDLDGSSTRMTVEESTITNVPRRFSILMPLIYRFDGTVLISANLDFEVVVSKKKDDFDRKTNQSIFELTCTNGRRALQGMMHQIIEQLPAEIPKYYGAKSIEATGGRD